MYKVLIIDDDPAMTELVTLLLKTHGLDAYMANSGEEEVGGLVEAFLARTLQAA